MQLSRYIKKIIKNQNFKARLNCSMHGLFLKISISCSSWCVGTYYCREHLEINQVVYILLCTNYAIKLLGIWCDLEGCLFFFWNWIWVLTRALRVFLMCGGIYDFSEKKYMLKAHTRNFKIFMNINGFMN